MEVTRYRWGFDLVNVNSVEGLSWGVHGPDAAILREEEDAMPAILHFSSRHFNELDNPKEVVARGRALKALFDGSLYIAIGARHRREPLRELWDLRGERRIGSPEPAPGIGAFSTAVCNQPLTDSQTAVVLGGLPEGALYCARTDGAVSGMLYTLGRDGVDWKTLYSLTDTMTKNGMSIEQQARAAGTSVTEYKLFKRTANSFDALGPDARHGETAHEPPPTPMTLDRAADLVLAAARAFVLKRTTRATAPLAQARDAERAKRTAALAAAKAGAEAEPSATAAPPKATRADPEPPDGVAGTGAAPSGRPPPIGRIGLAAVVTAAAAALAVVAVWRRSRRG